MEILRLSHRKSKSLDSAETFGQDAGSFKNNFVAITWPMSTPKMMMIAMTLSIMEAGD
jgi:hypothetical protein